MTKKDEWILAGVAMVVLLSVKSCFFSSDVSANKTTTSSAIPINQNRQLSPLEAKFAILGVGLGPMMSRCTLSWWSGRGEDATCTDKQNLTYWYSADHKTVWKILREETLPDTISFADVVEQMRQQYGEPESYNNIGCQAIWGDTSHISLTLKSAYNCSELKMASTTGLTVKYELSDMDEYSKISHAEDKEEEEKRVKDEAAHKI